MFYFRMQLHTETRAHRICYLLFETDDFLRSGLPAVVDEHQRLLCIHRSSSTHGTLEAALLYHPGSRNLYESSFEDIVRHAFIAFGDG